MQCKARQKTTSRAFWYRLSYARLIWPLIEAGAVVVVVVVRNTFHRRKIVREIGLLIHVVQRNGGISAVIGASLLIMLEAIVPQLVCIIVYAK